VLCFIDSLSLRAVRISSSFVRVQWNCSSVDSHKLTWAASLSDEEEQWQRIDEQVFDLCQDQNKIDQLVFTTISHLEADASYTLSLVAMNDSFTKSMITVKTLTSGMHVLLCVISFMHNNFFA